MAKKLGLQDMLRKDPCAYCGRYQVYPEGHKKAGRIHATIDHIHPKSEGGENIWVNYTAACSGCNTRKGSNSLLGFLLGEQLFTPATTILDPTLHEFWFDPFNLKRALKPSKAVDIRGTVNV